MKRLILLDLLIHIIRYSVIRISQMERLIRRISVNPFHLGNPRSPPERMHYDSYTFWLYPLRRKACRWG